MDETTTTTKFMCRMESYQNRCPLCVVLLRGASCVVQAACCMLRAACCGNRHTVGTVHKLIGIEAATAASNSRRHPTGRGLEN
jgi:hypothetical protein